jgi:hypothetical protein
MQEVDEEEPGISVKVFEDKSLKFIKPAEYFHLIEKCQKLQFVGV